MKNIHVLPTDKLSRLCFNNNDKKYQLCEVEKISTILKPNQHIYITNSEEIKEGINQWYIDKVLNDPYNSGGAQYSSKQDVIILTTDPDLIKEGIQPIDDEFLEWFVKNPSCESVEVKELKCTGMCWEFVESDYKHNCTSGCKLQGTYKIILPTQETLEEKLEKIVSREPSKFWKESDERVKKRELEKAAKKTTEKYINEREKQTAYLEFIEGAKFQSERIYSEEKNKLFTIEDVKKAFRAGGAYVIGSHKDFQQTHFNEKEFIQSLLPPTQ